MKANLIAACALALALPAMAKTYTVTSPDKRLSVAVDAGPGLTWSISRDGTEAMAPSAINLMLADGRTAAGSARVTRTHRKSTDTEFATPLYRKTSVADRYNELSLDLRGGYTLQVRAYDDAAAYRFVLHQKDSVDIAAEHAEFRFGGKHKAWLPLINDLRDQAYPFAFSFESYYDEMPLADMPADTLSCTPLLVELDGGRKALVMEGALSSYPGMFLRRSDGGDALQSVHAPLPVADKVGGFNRLNLIPTADAGIIARVAGDAALP